MLQCIAAHGVCGHTMVYTRTLFMTRLDYINEHLQLSLP